METAASHFQDAPVASRSLLLIVDDDVTSTALLSAMLARHFDVMSTADPTRAVELARRSRPCVILCDINMPDLPGDEVANLLADDPLTYNIPIVYLTGLLEADDTRVLDGEFGGHWAVSKSAPRAELLRVIDSVVQ